MKTEKRVELLKLMHEYIKEEVSDETAYEVWVCSAVPDEPSEEDFKSIANDDDDWNHSCKVFGRLLKYE